MLIHKERLFQNDLETSYLSIGVKSAKKQIYKASENQDEILMEDRTFSQSEMEFFSKDGQLIEWKLSFANDNNPSGGRLNYNEKGQLKEEFEYEGDKLIQKAVYYYDGKGRLIQTEYFRFKNSIKAELNYKVKYTYDDIRPNIERNEEEEVIFSEREQPNQEAWYNDRDIITKLRSYHYDAKGRIIGIIEENKKEEGDDVKREFKYSEDGKTIELISTTINGETELHRQKANYDEHNNQIAFEFKGIHENYKVFQEFDVQGSLIERTTNGNKINWRYEYDERGNWIRQACIRDNKVIELTERLIEYYE